jgi:small-conductance mechanosensitive channel
LEHTLCLTMDIKAGTSDKDNVIKPTPKSIVMTHKYWIGGYSLVALVFLCFYFLLHTHILVPGVEENIFEKIAVGCFAGFLVLIIGRVVELIVSRRSQSKTLRYTLIRVIRLVTALLILLVIITFLFQNWYTAAASLGLISLILGFALQVPISSFIAWLYIIFRSPYRVGDRIELNQFKGDVVEIGYLDTTLWEFGGDYLTTDMPSGRLIRFPNSLVMQSAVFNYSWPKFPYIWNEIPFHIAYESDFAFVETTLKEVTKKLEPQMADKVRNLKELVKQTAVDELEIKEYPFVSFRTNTNTWVEALVTYLVEPKRATIIRTRIVQEAVKTLKAEPDKVCFLKVTRDK